MGLDWGQIDDWTSSTDELDQLYTDLSTRATTLSDLQAQLGLIRNDEAWVGQAEHASQQAFDDVDDTIVEAAAAVAAVRTEVQQTSAALRELDLALRAAEQYARDNGFMIQDSGMIVDLWIGEAHTAAEWDKHDAAEDELSRMVTAVRERANEIETEASRVLYAASSGEISTEGITSVDAATAVGSVFALGDMPPPQQVEDWRNGLSSEQQQWVTQNHPDWVRNLDGIPVVVRDEANRVFLDAEIARAEAEMAGFNPYMTLPPMGDPRYAAWLRWRDLTGIRTALDETPDSFLIGLDTSEQATKVIMSVGNPDEADHVAVTIPGMGSQDNAGSTMQGMLSEGSLVRTEAELALDAAGDSHQSVATVAWMNYETPPWVDGAASESMAQAGAPVVSNYLESVDVTSTGTTDPHLTLVGHSYGSLVSGLALNEGGNAVVDDFVAYGSPGFYADDAADLGMQDGHVYVMQAPDDDIQYLDVIDGWYGSDPADGSFVHLSTDATTTVDNVQRDGAHEHADYPRPTTINGEQVLRTSGYNVAVVVAGLPENAVPR